MCISQILIAPTAKADHSAQLLYVCSTAKSSYQIMKNTKNDTILLRRNQYIQTPNHLASMIFKMVPIGMDGVKEPSNNSTTMVNIIAVNQAGVMNLIFDAKLKQNSKLFVDYVRSSISPSREVFRETHLSDHRGQGERTWLFFVVRRL